MTMKELYSRLAFENPEDLIFGKAKTPMKYGFDLEVGNGKVIPEIKFFPKPNQLKSRETTVDTYKAITTGILKRSAFLGIKDVQLELELPSQLTKDVKLGGEVIHAQKEILEKYKNEYGINSALKGTVADIRNETKEGLRGDSLDLMIESFEEISENGVDAVCIESFGGKEVFVDALTQGDISGVLFSTGLLASIDVSYLWQKIVETVRNRAIPTGDTACAHANSAMVLAGGFTEKMISHVFAAVVRAVSAVRTLASYEAGGIGPGKDCAYENTIIKAITGYPMSLEGKSSACAHSSLIGNIPMAVADLWSNESIEYTKLYGGMGPEVSLEMLFYDTSLLNTSIYEKKERILQDLIIKSNSLNDPQALILTPENSIRIAKAIIEGSTYYERSINAAFEAVKIINESKEKLNLPKGELRYIRSITTDLEKLPDDESAFIDTMVKKYTHLSKGFLPRSYEL